MPENAHNNTGTPPAPVLPYVSTTWRDPAKRLRSLAAVVLVFAIVGTVFDTAMSLRAASDWRDADRVVRSRDPARRIIKGIERGRPGVFPSRTWLALFLLDQTVNVALNVILGIVAWQCVESGADPLRIWRRVQCVAGLKLLLVWLGPLVAIGLGSNLSRVRDEFEVLGDWRHLHVWTYGLTGFVAAGTWGVVAVLVLRPARSEA